MKFILVILTLPLITYGQADKTRVLFRSQDMTNSSSDTLDVKTVRMAFWSDSIVVKLKDKRKLIFAPGNVWGYETGGKNFYRYSNGEFIDVRQMDSLVVYSKKRSGYRSSHIDYYFSKTTDSKIFLMSWKNFKNQFSDNPCVLNKLDKELKWYENYSAYDDATNSYKLVEFYKSCTNSDDKR